MAIAADNFLLFPPLRVEAILFTCYLRSSYYIIF